ncbi:MAG: DUF4926 domain-containing protein [bacterium]
MIQEHEHVVLTADLPDDNLKVGDVGTVVHIYRDAAAYEVEFFRLDGATVAVATVTADHLRAVDARDILHTRPILAA